MSKLLDEEVVATSQSDGSFDFVHVFHPPQETCAVWISADGDDTKSSFPTIILNPAVGWPKRTKNAEKKGSSEAAAVHPAGECPRLRKALKLFVFFRFFQLNCCF